MALDSKGPLDFTDWQILRELQINARISYAEIGRRVGLSLPATAERIHKMEEAGIITGYHAQVDTAKIGFPITAFIRVRTSGERSLKKVRTLVNLLPEVVECYHLTGEDYFIIKMVASSIHHLEETIEHLQSYGQTTTSIVLSELMTRRVFGEERLVPSEGEAGTLPLKARISKFRPPES